MLSNNGDRVCFVNFGVCSFANEKYSKCKVSDSCAKKQLIDYTQFKEMSAEKHENLYRTFIHIR